MGVSLLQEPKHQHCPHEQKHVCLVVNSVVGSPTTLPSSVTRSITGKSSLQMWVKALLSASMVNNKVLVWRLLTSSTRQFAKLTTKPVLIFTHTRDQMHFHGNTGLQNLNQESHKFESPCKSSITTPVLLTLSSSGQSSSVSPHVNDVGHISGTAVDCISNIWVSMF